MIDGKNLHDVCILLLALVRKKCVSSKVKYEFCKYSLVL